MLKGLNHQTVTLWKYGRSKVTAFPVRSGQAWQARLGPGQACQARNRAQRQRWSELIIWPNEKAAASNGVNWPHGSCETSCDVIEPVRAIPRITVVLEDLVQCATLVHFPATVALQVGVRPSPCLGT